MKIICMQLCASMLILPFMHEMPSREARKAFAKSTQKLTPDYAKLTEEELEIWDEEEHGQPVNHGTSAEGIAAMTRRIAWIITQKAKVITQLERDDLSADARTRLDADLANLTRQMNAAAERKASYEAQLKQAN